jgi:translocation protein SEC66
LTVEAQATSWFPPHTARDLYISLLQLDPPPPESILKSALLQRAMTDVRRILRMRDDKVAAQLLLQKGTVGDELWSLLLKAEKELEAEVLDVVNEANTFSNAWGPGIFATAGEMCIREKTAVDWNLLPEGPLPTRTSLETSRYRSLGSG